MVTTDCSSSLTMVSAAVVHDVSFFSLVGGDDVAGRAVFPPHDDEEGVGVQEDEEGTGGGACGCGGAMEFVPHDDMDVLVILSSMGAGGDVGFTATSSFFAGVILFVFVVSF